MIVDDIQRWQIYSGVSDAIAEGLRYLSDTNLQQFYGHEEEIYGGRVRAIFEQYQTKSREGLFFEAHNTHIDIQFVVSGTEAIRVTPRADLAEHTPYDSAGDVTLYHPGDSAEIVLNSGQFAVLYPHEAHLPQLSAVSSSLVRKVVLKVPV